MEKKYRDEIDGIRAIAVWAVLICHLDSSYLPSGFIGVDIFFVLSGYVVTMSVRDNKKNVYQFFLYFLSRRIKRLMPALLFSIVFACSLLLLLVPPVEIFQMLKVAKYALFGGANLALIHSSLDYFGIQNEFNPFTHTWSLAVEEQFYLIFPFYFVALQNTIKGVKRNLQIMLLLSIPLLASFLGFVFMSFTDEIRGYYLMPVRFWELALGMNVYFFEDRNTKYLEVLGRSWFKSILFVLLIGSFALPNVSETFPLLQIVVAALLTTIFILPFSENGWVYRLLLLSPLKFFGKVSYSLYLYHFIVFVLFRWTLGLESLWNQVIAVSLSCSLAIFSYYYIENPIRISKSKNIILKIVFLNITLFVLINKLPSIVTYLQKDSYTPLLFSNFDRPKNWKDGVIDCHFRYYKHSEDEMIQTCLGKKNYGLKNVYLIGDSHALQLVEPVRLATKKLGATVSYIHNNGIPLLFHKGKVPREIDFALSDGEEGDILMLTFFRGKFYDSKFHIALDLDPFQVEGVQKRFDNLKKGIAEIGRRASLKKMKIILVDDVPQMKLPIRVTPCIFQDKLGLTNSCDVLAIQSLHSRVPMTQLFKSFVDEKLFFYWDPHPFICNKDICYFKNESYVKMTDHNHISLSQAEDLTVPLLNFLKKSEVLKE